MSSKLFKKRSPLEIGGIVVIFLLLLAIIGTFVLYGVFKDTGTAPMFFGSRVYIMNGDGMEPRIPAGSAVFVNEGVENLGEGKVVLCSIDGQLALVGYVTSEQVMTADGNVEIRHMVKYDNASENEVWGIGDEDIIGVAKTYSKGFGGLVNFASSKTGMLLIVIVPCALLMAYEIVMLILSRGKKKDTELADAVADDTVDPDDEIERLRQEILNSRKKQEEAAQAKEEKKDDLGGTRPFKLEFTSDKKEEQPLEFKSGKTEEKSATDSTIQLRSAKTEPVVRPKQEPKEEEPVLEFKTKSEPVLEFKSEPEVKADPVIDVTKMTSSDIDELIRMLEAEKNRLADK